MASRTNREANFDKRNALGALTATDKGSKKNKKARHKGAFKLRILPDYRLNISKN